MQFISELHPFCYGDKSDCEVKNPKKFFKDISDYGL